MRHSDGYGLKSIRGKDDLISQTPREFNKELTFMLVYMYFLTNPITSFFYLAVFTPAISHYRSFIKHCDFCFNDWSKKKKFHFSELLINLMARKKLILKNLIACFVAKPIPRTAH